MTHKTTALAAALLACLSAAPAWASGQPWHCNGQLSVSGLNHVREFQGGQTVTLLRGTVQNVTSRPLEVALHAGGPNPRTTHMRLGPSASAQLVLGSNPGAAAQDIRYHFTCR